MLLLLAIALSTSAAKRKECNPKKDSSCCRAPRAAWRRAGRVFVALEPRRFFSNARWVAPLRLRRAAVWKAYSIESSSSSPTDAGLAKKVARTPGHVDSPGWESRMAALQVDAQHNDSSPQGAALLARALGTWRRFSRFQGAVEACGAWARACAARLRRGSGGEAESW